MRLVDLAASDTHDLRRRVLRVGTVTTSVVFDGDDEAVHLGLVDDGVVAVSSWFERRHPDRAALTGFQLRGMAVEPERAGSGLGSRLLAGGVERMAALGAELVWARARDTALTFYTSRGFEVFGEGYVDLSTGLPHHDVIRLL
ncbi:MAG: GNAT family N-acetyltransferase [Ilumatobacteraceae bacterium]